MVKTASLPQPRGGRPASKRPQPVPHGHPILIALVLAALAAAAAAAWLMAGTGDEAADPTAALLDEMHRAAAGSAVATHAFGGALAVSHGSGRLNVTAESLPAKACVQVGWHLAKEGTIIVNGTLPVRLSAAKLADLCGGREGGATLTWVPDEAK